MSLPYFPMYPTDFEAKTSHLTLAEDGAYNRLLRICWMMPGCTMPADETWIMRRARAFSEEEQQAVRAVLGEFFDIENGRYSNARLTKEWLAANEAHQRRKMAGKKGGEAKSLKSNKTASSNAKAKLKQPEPEPELNSPPKSPKGFEEDFAEFWRAYPKREGGNPRKTALKAYTARRKAGATHDAIMQALRTFTAEQQSMGKIGTVYIPMASSWLNREEWEDEPAPTEEPSAAETHDDVWRGSTRLYLERGTWRLADRSPPPDCPNTLVPAHILREFNISQAA